MIRAIQAKTILSQTKPDNYFGVRYTMNLYRGCQHHCIYCDSRSECYQIADFDGEVLVKANAIDLLRQELPHKRVKGTIGTGSMNDPYMPLEKRFNLTGQALQVIAENRFPVCVITKSDLVLKDLDSLKQISREYAVVCFTLTTTDDDLAKKIEPGAPAPSRRLAAMRTLAANGILTGVTMMPILPFIEANPENIRAIVNRAADSGAHFILPWMGMSMRSGQREYFYNQLDAQFPGIRVRYEKRYGTAYTCPTPNATGLYELFDSLCSRLHLSVKMPKYQPAEIPRQMTLFESNADSLF